MIFIAMMAVAVAMHQAASGRNMLSMDTNGFTVRWFGRDERHEWSDLVSATAVDAYLGLTLWSPAGVRVALQLRQRAGVTMS